MNRFLYSLIIWLSIPFALIKILVKDTHNSLWKVKLKNQLGIVKEIKGQVIWIHCVSVGEFNASKPLVDALLSQYSKHKIVISTTTMTGSVAVKNHYKDNVIHCFFPFDSQPIIKSFLNKINPKICILMETEIWPNLIYSLNKKKIPAALINARLSQKSFEKYQKFSPKLVNESLNRISIICSQNSFTSDRFISLGVNKEKILTCGSLKFDINDPIDQSTINTLKNIVGGELKSYSILLPQARKEAMERMIDHAEELGADAVVNFRYETSTIAAAASEVIAYGTAVKLED